MCGIAGFVLKDPNLDRQQLIERLLETVAHRGPDGSGFHSEHGCSIGNTRLSIIDIEKGDQPFYSNDRKIAVVQNGEIYNFIELRKELESLGHSFGTRSDTEVILRAYDQWQEDCFARLNGMFAIAIADHRKQRLLLARDRLGVKPLYLANVSKGYLFSSEIKTFLKYSEFSKAINYQALHRYLIFNYVPQPSTIFSQVRHVEPGTFVEIDLDSQALKFKKYWTIPNTVENTTQSEAEWSEEIEAVLTDAVSIRLRSDVAVGAFLSGGLDSSTICALANKTQKLACFSVDFPVEGYGEGKFAARVATALGLPLTTENGDYDLITVWPQTTWHADQPHGDASFIPTYLLSKIAAKEVKVVLTGDGGDELFAGYDKHKALPKLTPTQLVANFQKTESVFLPMELEQLYSAELAGKIDREESAEKLFSETVSQVSNKEALNQGLYFDLCHLLPGNNLVKTDKMAMAWGLETRSPFLDFRLHEILLDIPSGIKMKGGEGKYLLKKLATPLLPTEIVAREKQTFSVPVGEWFKGKANGFLRDMLSQEVTIKRGLFDPDYVQKLVEAHISGGENQTRKLRALVNLELWIQRFMGS